MLRKRCQLANGRRSAQDHSSLSSTTWWEAAVNCYSPVRTLFVKLPADLHGWWNSNEQESCVTGHTCWSHPFSLKFSELSPWVFARTWTTAQNYPNYTNLLLKQHTSYQNIPLTTSSKRPGKAVHSGTKIAKYKTTKSNKNTCLTEEKYCHECLGVWVALRAYWSYSCSQWIIYHQTPVETVWSSQWLVSSVWCDTEAEWWTGSFEPSLCVQSEFLTWTTWHTFLKPGRSRGKRKKLACDSF